MNRVSADTLMRKADELDGHARALRKLATVMAEAPDPLGHHIILLAVCLKRYDLCVIHRDVLAIAKAVIESSDPDDSDHPREVAARQREALQAIDQSLSPERWISQTQQAEAAHV